MAESGHDYLEILPNEAVVAMSHESAIGGNPFTGYRLG